MNIHERSSKVFMNYSQMFLKNKWDIHEKKFPSHVHQIEAVHERLGTRVVQ